MDIPYFLLRSPPPQQGGKTRLEVTPPLWLSGLSIDDLPYFEWMVLLKVAYAALSFLRIATRQSLHKAFIMPAIQRISQTVALPRRFREYGGGVSD